MTENNWDAYAICYECRGYGDDYYQNSIGELVCACGSCWVMENEDRYDD